MEELTNLHNLILDYNFLKSHRKECSSKFIQEIRLHFIKI